MAGQGGVIGTILGWVGYQLGMREDAASATGSLHAKVKDVKSVVSTIAEKNIINHGSAIKSIQRGTIAFASSDVSKTVTISQVATNKTMLNYLGATISGDIIRSYYYQLRLTSATQITATRGSGHSTSATTYVSYEVIEYY